MDLLFLLEITLACSHQNEGNSFVWSDRSNWDILFFTDLTYTTNTLIYIRNSSVQNRSLIGENGLVISVQFRT